MKRHVFVHVGHFIFFIFFIYRSDFYVCIFEPFNFCSLFFFFDIRNFLPFCFVTIQEIRNRVDFVGIAFVCIVRARGENVNGMRRIPAFR